MERPPTTSGERRGGLIAVVVLALLQAGIPSKALAQDPGRPKIGLALGGGSARGFAHVGVLKWLEENRIPVDYISGTSMGGLIGGAYATGMSADEIELLLKRTDWDLMFKADAPYSLKDYRRKEDARDEPVKLEVGLRHGLGLPSGLNPGHHIGALLSRIALPYSTVRDFDLLPIPFRCIATDMKSAEEAVLGSGSLGTALRATMAIPAVFDPVSDGDRLLSDGGMLDNVPVDVVKAMGADVVIAVKVSSPTLDPVSENFLSMAERGINVMMENLEDPHLKHADVVVVPALSGINPSDFRKSEAIAKIGYDAVSRDGQKLLRFSLDEASWRAHQEAKRERRRELPAKVSFIEVTGVPKGDASRLRSELERKLGSTLDPAAIEVALERIVGTGRYAAASYGLVERGGETGLDVAVREKTYAPPFLDLALDVSGEEQDTNVTLASRVTFMDPAGRGSEFRVDGSVGQTLGLSGELLMPVGAGGLFVAPRVFTGRAYGNVYEGSEFVAAYDLGRSGGGFDLGWIFRNGELRLGLEADRLDASRRVGDEDAYPNVSGTEEVARAAFVLDTRDDAFFSKRGMRLDSSLRWYLSAPPGRATFGQLTGGVSTSYPGPGNDRGFVSAEGGAVLGQSPGEPQLYALTLGGPFRLSAFAVDQFRGRYSALARTGYLHTLAQLPAPLADRLYLVGVVELGSAFDRVQGAELRFSGTAGLAVDTLLGPSFLGVAVGNGGTLQFFLAMGTTFH